MIVLLGGEKGGSGKSTLCVNLALMTALAGRKVLLIDGDKQQTASRWLERRKKNELKPSPDIEVMKTIDLMERLPDLAPKYDYIFIDIAGRDAEELRLGLYIADVVVFPMGTTLVELETASRMNDLVEQSQGSKSRLKNAYFVLNRVATNKKKQTVDLKNALAILLEFDAVKVAEHFISNRTVFERSSIAGACVSEAKPSDKQAVQEISELIMEVLQ
jgi:chromosome partitioning protein